MKCAIIYLSPNRTTKILTKKMADIFQNRIETEMIDMAKLIRTDFAGFQLEQYDVLGIGTPTYHLRALKPVMDFINCKMITLTHNTPVFIYTTYAGVSTGKCLIDMAEDLYQNGFPVIAAMKVVAPHFWQSLRDFPEDEIKPIIRDFARTVLIRINDIPEWKSFKQRLKFQKPFIKLFYPFSKLVGKMRNQYLRILAELCNQCGACVSQCPVSSLYMKSIPERNNNKCIHCYHCATICSRNAITISVDKIQKFVRINKRIAGMEQPANSVY